MGGAKQHGDRNTNRITSSPNTHGSAPARQARTSSGVQRADPKATRVRTMCQLAIQLLFEATQHLQDATDLVASRMTMVTALRRFRKLVILELTAGYG